MYNKLYIGYIFLIITLLVLSTGGAYAGHETCVEGQGEAYCDVTLDWEYIFSEIESPSTTDTYLDGPTSTQYQNLFQGIDLIFDDQTENYLIGERRPSKATGSPYTTYENPIGYPQYRYEIHGWGSDKIPISDGKTTEKVSQEIYEASWPKDTNDDLNVFKVDSAFTSVSVPDGTSITINLYSDSSRDPSDKVGEAVYDSDDYVDNDEFSVRSTSVDGISGDYQSVYWTEAELDRGSLSNDKPILGNNTVLIRNIPEFRITSEPYDLYPNEITHNFNEKMSENYESEYGGLNEENSYMPRISQNHFTDTQTSDGEFSNKDVFYNTYSKITSVNKSVKVQSDYDDMSDLGNQHVISNNGTIFVSYDSGFSEPPNDGNWVYDTGVSETSPDDGDLRWEYTRSDIEYEVEVGAREANPATAALGLNPIDTETTDESGSISVDYNTDDYSSPDNRYGLSSFYSRINVEVKYDINYEDYYIDEDNCPADNSPSDEDYDDWVSESDCNDPSDTYIDQEYWQNYAGEPPGKDECVEYAMGSSFISEDTDCNGYTQDKEQLDYYYVRDNGNTDPPKEDDFNTTTAYIDGDVKTYVNKTQGERWTDMESDTYIDRNSIVIREDKEKSERFYVPTTSGYSKETTTDTYSVDGSSIDFDRSDYRVLDGEIGSDTKVYLDLYTTGPIESSEGIDVSVDGDTVYDSNSPTINRDDNLIIKNIAKNINITNKVKGDSEFDLEFDHSADNNLRIDYAVKVQINDSFNIVSSRWSYATFRDSRWSHIYEYTDPCSDDSKCYNYSSHGHYIAEGDNRGFASGVNIPSEIDVHYPSPSIPVHTYLVPTSRSIDSQQQDEDYQDVNIETFGSVGDINYDPDTGDFSADTTDGVADDINGLGNGVVASKYTPRLYSEACPYRENDRNYADTKDQYCGFSNAYAAGFLNERVVYENNQQDYSVADIGYIEPDGSATSDTSSDSDVVDSKDAFESPFMYSETTKQDYGHLNGESATPWTTIHSGYKYYPEYTNFTINTEGFGNWSVSGNATWSSTELESEDTHIFDTPSINIQKFDVSEISSSKRSALNSQTADHTFVDEPPYDSMTDVAQVKITIVDQNGEPINFKARRNNPNDLSHKILVGSSYYDTRTGTWNSESHRLNENGTLYAVVDSTADFPTQFEGDIDKKWWNMDSDLRLLGSASNSDLSFDPTEKKVGDVEEGRGGFLRFIIFVLLAFSFVLSYVAQSAGSDNMTVGKILKTASSPLYDALKTFTSPFSEMILLLIAIMSMAAVAGVNPFIVIDTILGAFLDTIFGP